MRVCMYVPFAFISNHRVGEGGGVLPYLAQRQTGYGFRGLES